MAFAGMNYLAIGLAAIAGYVFGAVYYMALSKPWLAASEKTEADIKNGSGVLPFVLAFVAAIVMAHMLAGILGHLGPGQVTLRNGLISAAFIWVGFVATTTTVNYAFQGRKAALTLIDSVHWLGVLLIQGAVIGALG